MRNFLKGSILISLFGCSSIALDPYQIGLKKAFDELDQNKRSISSDDLGISVSNISPHEMLLFPKAFDFNHKMAGEYIDLKKFDKLNEEEKRAYFVSKDEYLIPLEFQIRPLVTDICTVMAAKEGSQFDSYDFLTGRTFNPTEKCMVVEVKRKFFGKKNLEIRRDDLLKVYLYLGENLKPYGKKVFLAVRSGRERFRTVDIFSASSDTLSSELDLTPTDIPNPSNFAIKGNIKSVKDKIIRIPPDLFVMAEVNKKVKIEPCQKGHHIDYKDILGNPVAIDWCEGEGWPRAINTPRFFAIKR